MISRRSFLVGLGAIVTSGFVKDARTHARRAGRPLLIEPVRPKQTLYLYENPADGPKWRASLGPAELLHRPRRPGASISRKWAKAVAPGKR